VSSRKRIAISLGDPRGIGPEVAFKAIVQGAAAPESVTYLGIERLRSSAPAGSGFVAIDNAFPRVVPSSPKNWLRAGKHESVEGNSKKGSDLWAGRISLAAILAAVRGTLEGKFSAVVTAPVHKPSLRAAGMQLPGQTELLAELSGASEVGMLMAAESPPVGRALRVLLATTHHPLSEVPNLVTQERLVRQVRMLDRFLRERWRMENPRIAVCALNPHASDGGLFGDEEATVFSPAVGELRRGGVDASGPVSADTVFAHALRGSFDAVVAPYHDVGMAAFKTAAFGNGVNVTLGLPFVRTSPDHGTAFDIAGQGVADPSSMVEAVRLAASLYQRQ